MAKLIDTVEQQLRENEKPKLSYDLPMMDRDASWLSFNYRVLQEAKDPTVPLLERLKFLAIYSSNLDEFFKVRVAQHRNFVRLGKKIKKELDYEPKKILKSIMAIVLQQQAEFRVIFDQIVKDMSQNNVRLLRRHQLSREQYDFVGSNFTEKLLPFVQPVLLQGDKVRMFLNNAALYLTIVMREKEGGKNEDVYAIVKIPSDYQSRFINLPSLEGFHDVIMLDDVVRHSVSWLFPGYDIMDTYSIKLTRDAELYYEEEGNTSDMLLKLKSSLIKRNMGAPSRFVYDLEMPPALLSYLVKMFEVEKGDLLPEGRYHNNFDFFKFLDFGLKHLKNQDLPPLPLRCLQNMPHIFEVIAEKDRYIHLPYHSYESVVQFFERAALDPRVTHIKIVQYRVAKKSRIMNAIMEACKAGKSVTVFIEVKARFDEEANLKWGETLQEAGVNVHYSFPGVKVHSKLALVRRREADGRYLLYSYMSTGNFHEDTAKVYTDLSLFTADPRYTQEVARIFNFLESGVRPVVPFEHLLVGQFNLRTDLTAKLEREILHAKAGLQARIVLKMNALQDPSMIAKLYEASMAGVEIKLIIRGICTLMPGVPGLSDNIEVISIVDRYLEHHRVFIFYNDGNEEVYLSSADWMVRNLTYRVETCFPVYDHDFRSMVLDTIDIQLNDNTKARYITPALDNPYKTNNQEVRIRSQMETYHYLKRIDEEEKDRDKEVAEQESMNLHQNDAVE